MDLFIFVHLCLYLSAVQLHRGCGVSSKRHFRSSESHKQAFQNPTIFQSQSLKPTYKSELHSDKWYFTRNFKTAESS